MLKLLLTTSALMAAVPTAAAQTIVVAPGDSLSAIAARGLGDAHRWPELCEINKAVLNGNCDLLAVGATIGLPQTRDGDAAAETPSAHAAPSTVEAAREGTTASEEQSSENLTNLTVAQMPEEHLTIAPGSLLGGKPAVILTTLPDDAQRRVGYLIGAGAAKEIRVSLSLRPSDLSNLTLLLYSGSRGGTFGTIDFDETSNITTTGAVADAAVTRHGPWLDLTFSFELVPGQTTAQLLIYPDGTVAKASENQVSVEIVPPTALGVMR